jgi:hypothetical protein
MLLRRTGNVEAEDASIAFKHVRLVRRPDAAYRDDEYAAFHRKMQPLAQRHYRFDLAVKMLLRPLGLGGFASRIALPLATAAARRFLFA